MVDVTNYLEGKGIQIIRDDGSELACYCPFHQNTDTPAFFVNKNTGLWICFNPACGKTGSIKDLMEFFGDTGNFVREYSIDEIELNLLHEDEDVEDTSWGDVLEEIMVDLSEDSYKFQYLLDRGFTLETLRYFNVAYSDSKNRIVIPARDYKHLVIGFIGRTTLPDVQPKYLYSKGFPRKDTLFNLNNAKRYDSCIVVEGSLDALKVHQAGFPNVVSTLGASVTKGQIALMADYFDKIVIFSDNDAAGNAMRDLIARALYSKELFIVEFPGDDIKDPGDMSEEQIRFAVENAVDFLSWNFGEEFFHSVPV